MGLGDYNYETIKKACGNYNNEVREYGVVKKAGPNRVQEHLELVEAAI